MKARALVALQKDGWRKIPIALKMAGPGF